MQQKTQASFCDICLFVIFDCFCFAFYMSHSINVGCKNNAPGICQFRYSTSVRTLFMLAATVQLPLPCRHPRPSAFCDGWITAAVSTICTTPPSTSIRFVSFRFVMSVLAPKDNVNGVTQSRRVPRQGKNKNTEGNKREKKKKGNPEERMSKCELLFGKKNKDTHKPRQKRRKNKKERKVKGMPKEKEKKKISIHPSVHACMQMQRVITNSIGST
ncbi:hypothetical protein B0T19DRAFT_200978 [Cercophora scortea]|uniref:Uncharacterized protein n=1 Tax=Cercophora scortea TaxID=314031 RepID=A0AAE0IDQ4_9PEZI|nr:hypothetical protein B0T19DRAFT_200978 [Cercophora scortea]